LGAVTAAAWPCVASLIGDFFPARERTGIYGLILSGELIGTGIGFFISGEVSSLANWHWSFYAMAVPSLAIVWLVWRFLPEPERGKQGWISASDPGSAQSSGTAQKVLEANVQPRQHLVLRQDPTQGSLWWAIKYLLQLPTYDLLIIASTLAYFFFAGVRGFANDLSDKTLRAVAERGQCPCLYRRHRRSCRVHYWRTAVRVLSRKGFLNVRIVLPAIALYISIPFLGGGIWTTSVWLGIIMLTLGTCALAAAVAPIDAARLDIIHPRLWGVGKLGARCCAPASKAARLSCSARCRFGSAAAPMG
jgi:MFS family permease